MMNAVKENNKIYSEKYAEKKKPVYLSGRNYGIDLLRLIAMFYVVVLHTLRHGGISVAVEDGSSQFVVNWLLQVIAYGAVNIFALISGYVMYSEKEKPVRYSSYINLWFQVLFYGTVIGVILNIYNTEWVTRSDFIKMFFPVSNNLYWYFTAYTALFFITPFINAGIRGTSKKSLKLIFLSLIVFCSVFEFIYGNQKINNGYSFAWLLIVFILGGIIKKCEIGKNTKPVYAFTGIIIIVVIVLLWKIYGTEIAIFDRKITENTPINYVSPFILGIAILHLILFAKLRISNLGKKIIAFASPCAFAVYLLNTQYYVWNNILNGTFSSWAEKSWYILAFYVAGFSAAFVIGSVFVDRIRMFVFRKLYIDKFSAVLENGINKVISKVIRDDR